MSGNGATIFIKLTITRKALKITREDRSPARPRWCAAVHGNSAPRAAAPVIVIMKLPAMLTSALDMIFMAFAALEMPLTYRARAMENQHRGTQMQPEQHRTRKLWNRFKSQLNES